MTSSINECVPSRQRPGSSTGNAVKRFLALAVPAAAIGATALIGFGGSASAGIVPSVPLLTAGNYSVLAGQTVTNTGPSILGQSVGLSPGSAIVGFPPGSAASYEAATAPAAQAQADLTAAYDNAALRPSEFALTAPDLAGLTLAPGVYTGGEVQLSGQLVLDGQGNPNAVFIFQAATTLITGSASSVEVINGASECNVFWQVGSSATLGTNSSFVGNILALTNITVSSGAVVHGRALARNAAVTLGSNTFVQPSCVPSTALVAPATTTTTTASTSTTTPGAAVTTTPVTSLPALSTTVVPPTVVAVTTSFVVTNETLPATGTSDSDSTAMIGAAALLLGGVALVLARRRIS